MMYSFLTFGSIKEKAFIIVVVVVVVGESADKMTTKLTGSKKDKVVHLITYHRRVVVTIVEGIRENLLRRIVACFHLGSPFSVVNGVLCAFD